MRTPNIPGLEPWQVRKLINAGCPLEALSLYQWHLYGLGDPNEEPPLDDGLFTDEEMHQIFTGGRR